MNIYEILKKGETSKLEFKEGEKELPKSFWETYSAFANTDGGIVFLGIEETKGRIKIKGVQNPDKIVKEIHDLANNPEKVSKNILNNESIKIIETEDRKKIIIIEIPEAPYIYKPIYISGNPKKAYERFGEGDRKLTEDRYKALVVGSNEETDGELLKNYSIEDLDEESLELYRKELYNKTSNEKYKNIDYMDMLIEIGAFKKNRQGDNEYLLTVGGLLFFGKYNSITDRFKGFQLDYFEKESSLSIDWIDRVSTGDMEYPELNVFKFMKLVLKKFDLSIKDKIILEEYNEKSRMPYKSDLFTATREALVNCLMHAYYDSDMPIKIINYVEYIEFKNPGKMRITTEEFIHGGNSRIRNQTIATLMRRIGISEKAGSGGPRIFDIAEKYKLKIPEVKREQYSTTLRIWKAEYEDFIGREYNGKEKEMMLYIIKNNSINKNEALKLLEINKYEFRKLIKSLSLKGKIKSIGKGKSTRYILEKNTTEQAYSNRRLLKKIENILISRD